MLITNNLVFILYLLLQATFYNHHDCLLKLLTFNSDMDKSIYEASYKYGDDLTKQLLSKAILHDVRIIFFIVHCLKVLLQ